MTTIVYNKGKLITDTEFTFNYTHEQYEEALNGFLASEEGDAELKRIYRPSLDKQFRAELVDVLKDGKYLRSSGKLKQNGEVIRAVGIAGDVGSAYLVMKYLDRIGSEDTIRDYLDLVIKVIRTFGEGCFFSVVFVTDTGAWILDGENKPYKLDRNQDSSIVIGSGAVVIKGVDVCTFQTRFEQNDLQGTHLESRPVDEIKRLALADPLTNNVWKELVI